MSAMQSLQRRAYEASVRLGKIFHIPYMIVDPDGVDSELADFIDDDLDERVVAQLLPYCAGLDAVVAEAWEEFEDEKELSGHRQAAKYRRYCIAEHLSRRMSVPYIVCVQFQVVTYINREKKFPLGTLTSGWGYVQNDWIAAKSPDEAMRNGIRMSLAHQREAWEKAPEKAP